MSVLTVGGAIAGAMQVFSKLLPVILRTSKTKSLVHFTKSTRVEPIALVDQQLVHLEYTKDVMQTLNSIFISYYLQAVSIAVNVGRINVVKLLDSLNPQRDVTEANATFLEGQFGTESRALVTPKPYGDLMATESYKYGLPRLSINGQIANESMEMVTQGWKTGLESKLVDMIDWRENMNPKYTTKEQELKMVPKLDSLGLPVIGADGKPKFEPQKVLVDKTGRSMTSATFSGGKFNDMVHEAVNLSVGRLIEVTIEDQGKTATIPIQVRLISSIIQPDLIAHILGDTGKNNSAKERYHAWRAGQLYFWRDLVFCQDLIDTHRKTLMQDKSGTYATMQDRKRGNSYATMLSMQPSVASASNIVVVSHRTAQQIEAKIGGRLSDVKTRERMMADTYLMLIAVVDTDRELVTIYHNGISLPTKASVRELKISNKGKGPDLTEILKAYQLGQNPTL